MSKREVSEKLERLMARSRRRAKTMTLQGGLFVTLQDLDRQRAEHCEGCGDRIGGKLGKRTQMYFSQEFCTECVEKWMHGKK